MVHTVSVLPVDIQCGKRSSSASCPIAIAAKRTFPSKRVHVGTRVMIVEDKIIELPRVAANFVHEFDNGNVVNAITFGVNY